jgi:hypothetical protein
MHHPKTKTGNSQMELISLTGNDKEAICFTEYRFHLAIKYQIKNR